MRNPDIKLLLNTMEDSINLLKMCLKLIELTEYENLNNLTYTFIAII